MRKAGALWLAALTSLLLVSCTGSRESRTPVALVIAGEVGGGTGIGLVATGLPPSGEPGDEPLRWLDGFDRPVAGAFVDLAVTHDGSGRIYVLTRDGGADRLTRFDASALAFADPTSLARIDSVPIDVSKIVRDSSVLPEELCSRSMSVSSDGRWIGLLHDPESCFAATSTPTVLLVEIEGGLAPQVGPSSPTTDDSDATPVFSGTGDDEALVWSLREGIVKSLPLSDPSGSVAELVDLQLSGDVALARGGAGLVAAAADRLVSFASDGSSRTEPWPVPVAAGDLVSAVGSSLLPSSSAIALSAAGVVVVPDLAAEPVEEDVAFASVPSIEDAIVDPYGFLYAVSPAGIVTFDVWRFVAGGTLSQVTGGTTPVTAFDPLAVDWLFANR